MSRARTVRSERRDRERAPYSDLRNEHLDVVTAVTKRDDRDRQLRSPDKPGVSRDMYQDSQAFACVPRVRTRCGRTRPTARSSASCKRRKIRTTARASCLTYGSEPCDRGVPLPSAGGRERTARSGQNVDTFRLRAIVLLQRVLTLGTFGDDSPCENSA